TLALARLRRNMQGRERGRRRAHRPPVRVKASPVDGSASMTGPREHLIDWLRDAHAMEQHSGRLLQAQSKRLERYPALAERLQRHLEETQEQQQVLEQCLERLDASPSAMKDFAGRFSATAQTLATMMAADETVKSAITGYVFEQ